jgi:hypothetical protein
LHLYLLLVYWITRRESHRPGVSSPAPAGRCPEGNGPNERREYHHSQSLMSEECLLHMRRSASRSNAVAASDKEFLLKMPQPDRDGVARQSKSSHRMATTMDPVLVQ